MTTDENKSVLKTKLGLENLKGLGDTLKQIKEVKESLDEAQKTIGDLAKDNSPLGRALARLVEAQGLKTLNEDNINVSEEVRKTMAEELKNKEKTIEELEAKNKELTEDKVIREVTDTVKAELDKRLPQSGSGNDSGGGRLIKSLEGVVADYLGKRLAGSGGDTLGGDQIRNIIHEEVGKLAGGQKNPEQMVDDLVNALTVGDKLREKLGVTGIGGRLLQGTQGGESSLRTDLIKLLLEDQRDTLKIEREHEATTEKNKHLGILVGAVKENLGDFATAAMAAVEEGKAGTGAKTTPTPAAEQPHGQVFSCGDCHTEFSAPAGWTGQPLKCPNPDCGREYTKEELVG